MVEKSCDTQRAIAFDPCYIPKSGKSTEGISRFWSGCAGAVKQGLEICGIAALDLTNHTALHLGGCTNHCARNRESPPILW